MGNFLVMIRHPCRVADAMFKWYLKILEGLFCTLHQNFHNSSVYHYKNTILKATHNIDN